MVTLNDGRQAFRPVTALTLLNNSLTAMYSTGEPVRLADEAASPEQAITSAALDAGWLRWERITRQFSVATPGGRTNINAADFISGDVLLFEPVEALLASSTTTALAANASGVWEYHESDLSLTDASIVFYPMSLTAPIMAAHERFLTGSGEQVTTTQRGPITGLEFKIGAATFLEETVSRTVSVTLTINGSGTQNALLPSGFLWDSNRRGLAYDDATLLLQSDAGLHPISSQLTDFEANPNGLATGYRPDHVQFFGRGLSP